MGKQEVDSLWKQVQENHRKLETCMKHDFSIDITPQRPYNKRWMCSHCHGEVDTSAKSWYEQGLRDANLHQVSMFEGVNNEENQAKAPCEADGDKLSKP